MIDDNEDNVIRMLNLVIQRLAGLSLLCSSVLDFFFLVDDNPIVFISDYSNVHGPTESDRRSTDVRKDEREEVI